MRVAIEIRDIDEAGVLAVELRQLLALLEPEAQPLHWRIIDLEAVGDLREMGWLMLDLEAAVRNSPTGLAITWEQLKRFASLVKQVINLTLVGTKLPHPVFLPNTIESIESQCDIAIHGFDSSFWRVASAIDSVIERLRSTFRVTKFIRQRDIECTELTRDTDS